MFHDSQSADEQVVLLDVGRDPGQCVLVHWNAVDGTLSRDLQVGRVAERQAVEQCRLACSTGSHDGQELAWLHNSRNYLSFHVYFN